MSAMTLRFLGRAFVGFIAISAVAQNARLSSPADYRKYIDPLLTLADFGIHYYDDGAADASVLFPMTNDNPYDRPRQPVLELVRLGERSLPLLIDCLGDTRVSSVIFDGSRITKPMKARWVHLPRHSYGRHPEVNQHRIPTALTTGWARA